MKAFFATTPVPKLTAVMGATCLIGAGLLTATASSASAVTYDRNYVAGDMYVLTLGDSLAQGSGPEIFKLLKQYNPTLGYQRLACGGENASGFQFPDTSSAWLRCKSGGDEYSAAAVGYRSQLEAALGFIKSHPGKIALITISIGGNQFDYAKTPAQITRDIAQLRAAAGDAVPIVSQTMYATGIANWLRKDYQGARQAQWDLGWARANTPAWYLNGGATKVADMGAAFGQYTPLPAAGQEAANPNPPAVVNTCLYVRVCSDGNLHPTAAGYTQMARGIAEAAFGPSLVIPPLPPAVTPAAPPTTPTGLVGRRRDGAVDLQWDARPLGTPAVVGYKIEAQADGGAWQTVVDCTQWGAVNETVRGLTNGVNYKFRITAGNARGYSSVSAPSAAVTPVPALSAPLNLAATPVNNGAELTWTLPTSDGGSPIISHRTEKSTDGGKTWSTADESSDAKPRNTLGDLTNGVTYQVRVIARTIDEASIPSAPVTVIPAPSAPGRPRSLVATAGNASASLTWLAPTSDGGRPITGYKLEKGTYASGAWHFTTAVDNTGTAATNATVTGLTNGTAYRFRVSAINALGTGTPAESVSATPR